MRASSSKATTPFTRFRSFLEVLRWARQIGARPAVIRGRKVNRVNGPLEDQLHERHDASDFETMTQDKLQGTG